MMENLLLRLWGIAPGAHGWTVTCSAKGIYVTSFDSFFAIVFDKLKKLDPKLLNHLEF
jgi:hypothetical protein